MDMVFIMLSPEHEVSMDAASHTGPWPTRIVARPARGMKQMKQGKNKIRAPQTSDDERGSRRAWRLADSDTTLAS